MKKLLLVLAFVAASLVSQAQLFVAGNVGIKYSVGRTEYGWQMKDVDPIEMGFSITPAVGYMIPGKSYGFGLGIGYAYNSVKDYDRTIGVEIGDVTVKPYLTKFSDSFDFTPFFRYAFAKFDKVTLYVDAKLPIGFAKVKEGYFDEVVKDVEKAFAIGARLIPGLTYKFNSHILFTTEIGLLSVNYSHNRSTTASDNIVKIDNDFTLGANNRTVASFCFVYLF